MGSVVTVPPVIEPVTVAEIREFMGIGNTGDVTRDPVIKYRIKAARLWCEAYTNRYFMQQTLTLHQSQFCECACDCNDCAIPLKLPVQSIVSVKYLDANGVDTTLANTEYAADAINACLVPAYGKSWPVARNQPSSVRIEYLVGASTRDLVDERIKEAIRFVVMQWERFQNVDAATAVYPPDFPNVAKNLLSEFVDMRGLV